MGGGFARAILRPAFVFLLVAIIVVAIIVGIGNLLLELYPGHEGEALVVHTPDIANMAEEFLRPDLLTAFGLSLVVLFGGAIIARPRKKAGPLDEPIVIGETSMFEPVAPPATDLEVTQRGPLGTWADIQPGFTLYAHNGPLAKVIAALPAEDEYGKTRRGLLYSSGLYGANEEMWIPVEAVYAVYPETGSAFLAVKGDEAETYGWNRPPQSFRRGQAVHTPLSSY